MDKNYIEQLQAIIKRTGWTQQKLAIELGVTFAALNRWLNRRATPHPATRQAIYSLYKDKVGIAPLPPKLIAKMLVTLDREKRKHKNVQTLIKENKNLRDDLLLELTYNSNAIEGSTLTKKETETIIFDKGQVLDRSYAEHLEATNHAAALNRIFDGEFAERVTEQKIKELHQVVLQGINPDAGKYSKHQRAIRGIDLVLPAPEDIQEEMDRLLRQINRPKGKIVEHVAKMHAAFEAIHPFGDGNGRVGRLLMIVQLLNSGYAPCVVENKRKAEYYEALEYAQKQSETHLVKFIVEAIQKGYQIIKKHRR